MPRAKSYSSIGDVAKLLNAFKKAYPELKDLLGIIGGPKPEELFNKAVYYVKRAAENDPYHILGVSRDDPKDLVEGVYRVKAKFYHPDKGGENEKFARLNNAWQRIKAEKGW